MADTRVRRWFDWPTLKQQQFVVYRFANGDYYTHFPANVFCDDYIPPVSQSGAVVTNCIAGFGSGTLVSRFAYDLCGDTSEFQVTMQITSTP